LASLGQLALAGSSTRGRSPVRAVTVGLFQGEVPHVTGICTMSATGRFLNRTWVETVAVGHQGHPTERVRQPRGYAPNSLDPRADTRGLRSRFGHPQLRQRGHYSWPGLETRTRGSGAVRAWRSLH
jgi:hypothetical protein